MSTVLGPIWVGGYSDQGGHPDQQNRTSSTAKFVANRIGNGTIVGTAGNGPLIAVCSAGAGQTDDRTVKNTRVITACNKANNKQKSKTERIRSK